MLRQTPHKKNNMLNKQMLIAILFCLPLLLMNFNIRQARGANSEQVEILLSKIPPFVMNTGQGNSGLLWDLAHLLTQRLNSESPSTVANMPRILPWIRAYKELSNTPGKIMLQMARTAEREKQFQWLLPTTSLTFAFVKKYPPALNSLEEARRAKYIAVYRGSRLENDLRKHGFTHNLILTNDSQTGARLLNADRVSAWYAVVQEAQWLYKTNVLHTMPVIGSPVLEVPVWTVASHGTDQPTLAKLKKVLYGILTDGSFARLQEKYGLSD